jgi:programmed cell death 8 (apoptosis-inducing factor)
LLIGGGTASFAAFRAIKSNEPRAKVAVISDEEVMPYMRPPISKEIWFDAKLGLEEARFKQWNGAERSLYYEPEEFYMSIEKLDEAKNGGVSVIRGYTVTKLDVNGQKVTLDDGTEITYDKCLIATGSRPKTLDIFDRASPKVREKIYTYKTIKDFERVQKEVEKAKNIAIVGNGFLGSELACAFAHQGQEKNVKVYQLYPESGNMAKVLPSYLSAWTTKRIKEVGVEVMPKSQIIGAEIFEGNQVKLTLNNGTNVIVDFVVQAIGSEPNTELAKFGSLEIDSKHGGLVVNAELEARSNLYAAGDVACFYDPRLGRRRVEHHDHAVVSGRLAGENMVGLSK